MLGKLEIKHHREWRGYAMLSGQIFLKRLHTRYKLVPQARPSIRLNALQLLLSSEHLLLLVDFPPFNKEHPVKLVFNLKFPKLKSYHNFGINVVSIVYNKNPVTLKFDKNIVPGPVTMYMYLHV